MQKSEQRRNIFRCSLTVIPQSVNKLLMEVEDESHIFFHCPCYSDIRASAIQKLSNQNLSDDNDKLRYSFMNHPFILANLIYKIMAERKSYLYIQSQ